MTGIFSFDDCDGFIWYNGSLIPWRDANVHILNHGLHYGSCVFEGIRVYDGEIFKLTEHSQRLIDSAKILGFTIPYSLEELNNATREIIDAQDIKNGYIRPVAWRGSEQMAILTSLSSIHVAIATWVWPSYFGDDAKTKGLNLTFADWRRPAPNTAPTNSKAAGLYMICTLSKNAATQAGFADAMMLDYRGFVAEATGANFFLVIDGEIHTPIPDCFLDGITRRTVIDLARKRGFKVIERRIKPEELGDGQEAFLTGTAAEVTPIESIKGIWDKENNLRGDFSYTVGTVTRQLMDDYTALVNNTKNTAV